MTGKVSLQNGDIGSPTQFFLDPLVRCRLVSHNSNNSVVRVARNLVQELPLLDIFRQNSDFVLGFLGENLHPDPLRRL